MFFEWAFLSCLVNIQLFMKFGFFLLWIWISWICHNLASNKKQQKGLKKNWDFELWGNFVFLLFSSFTFFLIVLKDEA